MHTIKRLALTLLDAAIAAPANPKPCRDTRSGAYERALRQSRLSRMQTAN